jgi:hypothetical protein
VSGWSTGDERHAPVVDHLRSAGCYEHDALLYEDRAHLVAVAARFLQDGLEAGDSAVIATSAQTA